MATLSNTVERMLEPYRTQALVTIESAASVLDQVTWSIPGKKFNACCPVHDDSNPSLGVELAEDGKLLMTCYSQRCEFPDIITAIKELLPERAPVESPQDDGAAPTDESWWDTSTPGAIMYEIKDVDGSLIATHVRIPLPGARRSSGKRRTARRSWGDPRRACRCSYI